MCAKFIANGDQGCSNGTQYPLLFYTPPWDGSTVSPLTLFFYLSFQLATAPPTNRSIQAFIEKLIVETSTPLSTAEFCNVTAMVRIGLRPCAFCRFDTSISDSIIEIYCLPQLPSRENAISRTVLNDESKFRDFEADLM